MLFNKLLAAVQAAVQPLDPNIIAYTTFDNFPVSDYTGSTWANTGVQTTSNTISGSAIVFDQGQNATLTLDTTHVVDTTNDTDFTAEAWFRSDGLVSGGNQIPIRINFSGGDYFAWYLLTNTRSVSVYNDQGGTSFDFGSASAGNGTWSHCALVKNGTLLNAYVDGVLSATINTVEGTATMTSIGIGGNTIGAYESIYVRKGANYTGSTYTVPSPPGSYN